VILSTYFPTNDAFSSSDCEAFNDGMVSNHELERKWREVIMA
jgi:hypothetical protein